MDLDQFNRKYRAARHAGVYVDFIEGLTPSLPARFSTYPTKQDANRAHKGLLNAARKRGYEIRLLQERSDEGYVIWAVLDEAQR